MRNRWMTWVLCIISILGISTTGIMKAEAFSQEIWQEEKDKGNNDTRNPLAWRQAGSPDVAMPSAMATKRLGIPGFSADRQYYGRIGCTYYSLCISLVRLGVWNPETDGTVLDFVEDLESKGCANRWAPSGNEIRNYGYEQVECVKVDGAVGTYENLKKVCKEVEERGNVLQFYARFNGGNHAVVFDHFDENGEIVLVDCSMPDVPMTEQTNWWPAVATGGELVVQSFEYHVEGVDTKTNAPSLYERYGDGQLRSLDNKNKGTKDGRPSTDLDYTPLMEIAPQDWLDMGKIENQQEKLRLEAIQTEIKATDDAKIMRIISVTQAIVGILLCIYGLFLIVAGLYDKSNPFLDTSLVKVMTFGKWQYVDDDIGNRRMTEETAGITMSRIFVVASFLIGVGILILTGGIYTIVMKFFEMIISALKG